nr:SpaA isopeptide-forming pilin-related protein [uncultured Blautia sp.]
MLCLSCIVVFCTVYVLILPAITLERKTTCGQEEHVHTEECYSVDGQLICGREEHLHTETCYAVADNISDIQSDAAEWEANPIQEEDGNTDQDEIGNKVQEESGNTVQDEGNAGETEFMPNEPSDQDADNIEGAEGETEDMVAGFTSGDESSAEDTAEPTATLTPTPVQNPAGGFDLSAATSADKRESVKLFYKKADGNWEEFSKESNAPEVSGNPSIRLEVKYKGVQIQNLINSYNCILTYQLPTLLRDAKTAGKIMEGNQQVGTVTCQDGKIVVEFDKSYLEGLLAKGETTIAGDFYVEGNVDLSKLDQDGKATVSTADKTYYLNLGSDAVAKYGKINIEKTCISPRAISTESGNYLAYTITVTAGEDVCPDVSVIDTIMSNSNCVASYVGIDTTEKSLENGENAQNPYETIAEGKTHGTVYLGNPDSTNPVPTPGAENITTTPGSMVWKIGNMEAGESRTLTYYVKLKDDVGLDGKEIKNKADVYSKTYKRVYDDASFTPKIDYTMPKSHDGNIVRNSDGTYTIKYRLNFTLKKDTSNYALKNLEFRDLLDASDIYTDSSALPYISYDRDSVKLYKNETELPAADYTVSWANGDDNYVTPWNDPNNNPTRFKITGADGKPITVTPGDSYYATYTVTVKPEALAAMQANNVDVKNRYYVHVSNANSNFGDALNRVYDEVKVGKYKWDEKIVETGTATDQTIEMGTGVKYDLTSGTVKSDTSTDTFFTVPAGSYPYTVDVNQTLGEWNATNVSMKDEFIPSDKMQYIGYAKVEACEYNADTKAYDVKGTKWVKIAGLSSFALKPSDLGWSDKNYAYRFIYYAMPANAEFSSAKVNNKFSLSGQVGKDGKLFNISNIYSQKEITVSGSFKMNVKKDAWYYEEPETGAATWQNGKLYWVIEVSGTAILNGTYFRDAISTDSGLTDSYLHSDSLAGIYMGTLPDDKTIIGYSSLEELQNTGRLTNVSDKFLTKLTNGKGFTGTDNYSELSLQAKELITLGAAKLYFIVRTEPQSLPTQYRDAFTYRNHISTSDNGNTWIDHGSADKLLCGGADILKELGQTFTYDGTTVTSKKDGADKGDKRTIVTNALLGAGQYAAWAFKVNYAGELSGTYRVLEAIPDGMELAYIRIKWVGSQNFNTIDSKEDSDLETSGWTKKTISAATDNGGQSKTTTYYVKGNQALIKLGDFTAGKKRDDYSVDVQVVCRVTDPDVLLGGKTKTFTNQVTLQTEGGQDISTATSPAEITPKKIAKTFTTTNPASEKINFTIEANQFGEALSPKDGTTLTLIDKLSSTLILDTESIKVINSKTKAPVTDYTASLDVDNTLKIVIPRNVPVTITYTAAVNAPPGQKVSFSNEAYWEHYFPTSGTKVEENDYSYAAGGTVMTGNNIKLKIIKKDQNNLSATLQGAEFKMVPCTVENGQIKDNTAKEWTGTTDDKGELLFGKGADTNHAMNYNTIYKVTEITAPSGYVADSEPIYIMVPRIEDGALDYSDDVKQWMQMKDPKINIQYQSTYELTVLNHKGEITVEKKFKDPGGHDANPVSGTYTFGLYENADGTNATNPGGTSSGTTAAPLQTITITYNAAETGSKTAKFTNLDLTDNQNQTKTYYVFELDDEGNPIKDSATIATVNKMEYFTSYENSKTASATTEGNSAVNGDTVTVTNQIRVKELPSTGSYGSLIYRLAGAILILFAGLLMLINIKKQNGRNR